MSAAGEGGLSPNASRTLAHLSGDLDASIRELKIALRAGVAVVYDALDELEADGFIRRLPYRARSIEVLIPARAVIHGEAFGFIPMMEAA